MESNISTVCFRSNLYPVVKSCYEDREFQARIHDPFSLKILKENCSLTLIQQQEFRHASLHCSYADADDYPWGTILGESGHKQVVCKCINTTCTQFSRCRPDFDPSELMVHEENKLVQPSIFKLDESIKREYTTETGDYEASVKLFENSMSKPEPADETEISEKSQESVQDDLFVQHAPSEPTPKPVEVRGVDFHSFVESTQEDIIETDPVERIIVNAGPGTGKTWTIIEKIIRMINEETAAPENILVLCFSRSAVEVVKSRLSDAAESGRIGYEWRNVEVRTFDSFSTSMLAWVQDHHPELLPRQFLLENYDYDSRIRMAASVLKKKHDMLADYEHIIVDEVQDLVGIRAELVLDMLKGLPETCGFTVSGDSCQSIYDYIAADNPEIMSSAQFYEEIFRHFPKAGYLSLTENHRQGDELGELTIPYRKAILTGDLQERTAVAKKLLTDISKYSGRLQKFGREDAKDYLQQGTLGILTRTNGQALQISAWLRNEDVPHALQRGVDAPTLGDWISKLFYSYDHATIDETAFVTYHLALFPELGYDTAKNRWGALTSTQYGEAKSRYEISDLLRGLLRNSKDPVLYQSNDEKPYAVTVSNIHRAKGREFDSVIVIDDVIEAMTKPEGDDIPEHKVCYVALTRPRKRIERANFPTQYIYVAKNETRRCSKASLGRKKYISHFEVGADADLDTKSFGATEKVQEFIQNELQPGLRLKLMKCPKETKPYVTYRVVVEDAEHIVLGLTSKKFASELENAMQRIFKITKSVSHDVFPHAFCDVYVDSVITCISAEPPVPKGAKKYGDLGIWTGITITGFAAVDKDTY